MVSVEFDGVKRPSMSSILASNCGDKSTIVDTTHTAHLDAVKPKLPEGYDHKREFTTRWDEARRLREAIADRRRPNQGHASPEQQEFIVRALSRKDLIRRRLETGFVWFGGEIGGRWRPAFVEPGLRSIGQHNLQRLVQISPRCSRMQTSRSKDVMSKPDAKILGLDDPWIVLNSEVRSAFRIDLDHSFESWDDLRQSIDALPLPCLPHLAVGYEDDEGRIERPHVIYLLPYNQGAWFSDDPRCRRDVMALYRGVHAGLTKTFLGLGADPNALSNPMRIKNPLSPFWSYRSWNEDLYPSMEEWRGWVDTSASRESLQRESAAALAGAGDAQEKKASNVLFTTPQGWAYETLRDLDRTKSPDYVDAIQRDDRDSLAEILFNRLVGRASASAENKKQAQAILYRVTSYAAAHWDPNRCRHDAARDRGAASHLVADIDGVAARQAVGAAYTNDLRKSRSAAAIEAAAAELEGAAEPVTVPAIAAITGLTRPSIYAYMKSASCKLRCIVKKEGLSPAHETSPPPDTAEQTPPFQEGACTTTDTPVSSSPACQAHDTRQVRTFTRPSFLSRHPLIPAHAIDRDSS